MPAGRQGPEAILVMAGLAGRNGKQSHTQTQVVTVGSLDKAANEIDLGILPVQ
jgi:hypothetical protein